MYSLVHRFFYMQTLITLLFTTSRFDASIQTVCYRERINFFKNINIGKYDHVTSTFSEYI